MKMRIYGNIEEQNTWKREPENPQTCWAGWSLMIISPLLPNIILTLNIPVSPPLPPPPPTSPLFNCTYNYGDVRQMWPPWLICVFKQIIMHEQHDFERVEKAGPSGQRSTFCKRNPTWGNTLRFDKMQLQALVLPVKPPQFPHSQAAGCWEGKKRWLCLCPARSHRNGDECLDGILSYERAQLHLSFIWPCGTSGTSHTTQTRRHHWKWAKQTCQDWVELYSYLSCTPA